VLVIWCMILLIYVSYIMYDIIQGVILLYFVEYENPVVLAIDVDQGKPLTEVRVRYKTWY